MAVLQMISGSPNPSWFLPPLVSEKNIWDNWHEFVAGWDAFRVTLQSIKALQET